MNLSKINEKIYLTVFGIFSFSVIAYGSYTDLMAIEGIPSAINYLSLGISFTAGISGVLCVVLVARENIWNYFFGIMCVSLWLIYVVFWSPLIWDALINFIYLILNIYGLYYWLHPSKEQKSEGNIALTRRLTTKEKLLYTGLALLSIAILTIIGKTVGRYETSTQAAADAASTVFAILGQWFMSIKVLENWYMWLIVNLISIPLYLSIGSYTLAMVWVAYLINTIYGYIMWTYKMKHPELL